MPVFKLNTNAKLTDILSFIDSGVEREYLLDQSLKINHLYEIIQYAVKIKDKNIIPFIEVKFPSEFGRREKRIEIVGKNNNEFILYKFSKISKFDKDALELQSIINEAKKINNRIIKGILLFSDRATDTNFIISSLSSLTTDISGELV